jgi:hypothetical protein
MDRVIRFFPTIFALIYSPLCQLFHFCLRGSYPLPPDVVTKCNVIRCQVSHVRKSLAQECDSQLFGSAARNSNGQKRVVRRLSPFGLCKGHFRHFVSLYVSNRWTQVHEGTAAGRANFIFTRQGDAKGLRKHSNEEDRHCFIACLTN